MRLTTARATAALAGLGLVLAGCSPADEGETTDEDFVADASTCTKDQLTTLSGDGLTVATGEPAFPPWVVDDAPESGEGFEAAVAYAAADRLGFAEGDVTWTRTTFDSAVAPGPKTFDWNLQQYTISEQRLEAVDFSSPYYEASQAVVSYEGSPIAGATTIEELGSAKLGAAVGSTSLDDAQNVIDPDAEVAVYNDVVGAATALNNQQIDGLVTDTPSAFFLVGSGQVTEGVIVGQLPKTASGQTDSFGILLAKDSPMTACTTWAVDQLREDGTLQQLEEEWIDAGGAPVLQ